MADLKHSLISPDENFVVIQDPASSEGTKALTDEDRREITRQTSSSLYGNDTFESAYAGYNQQRQYGSYDEPQQYGQGYGEQYQNNGYDAPYYNEQGYQGGYNEGMYSQPYDGGYGQGYSNMPEEDLEDPYYVMDPRNKGSRKQQERQPADQAEGLRAKQAKNAGASGNQSKMSGSGKQPSQGKKNKQGGSGNNQKRPPKGKDGYYDKKNPESDVDPRMEKVLTVLMIIAAIILGIVAIFVVSKVIGIGTGEEDTKVIEEGMTEVPDVVGKTIEEASALLKNAGLTAKASYAESMLYDKDYIDSQDPAAGSIVEENTVLTLVVSSGKAEGAASADAEAEAPVGGAAVPDVVGKSEAEARVAIENGGFVFAMAEQPSETVEKGKVISQSPLGAEIAALGSSIQVYISSGGGDEEDEKKDEVQVPSVTGKDEATARALIIEAGLSCGNAKEEASDTVPKGNVISQSVAAGTSVEKGSNVGITISTGPSGYTCNATIQTPEGYLEGSEAIIVLLDANGAEVQRFSTTSFPYTAVKTGITTAPAGVITVTYQTIDGQWQTSAPTAVAFTKE
jgi:serine/threonine-protein kinase